MRELGTLPVARIQSGLVDSYFYQTFAPGSNILRKGSTPV